MAIIPRITNWKTILHRYKACKGPHKEHCEENNECRVYEMLSQGNDVLHALIWIWHNRKYNKSKFGQFIVII